MGMDVYGKKPTSEVGQYFRNNVWWWRPLAEYCFVVAPEIASKCTHWGTNDGDGLGTRDAKKLAAALRAKIADGHTEAWGAIRKAELDRLPDEDCSICGGTGCRLPAPQIGPGPELCNACEGKGRVRPWDTHYPFSVENVMEFAAFLEDCGGFKIC